MKKVLVKVLGKEVDLEPFFGGGSRGIYSEVLHFYATGILRWAIQDDSPSGVTRTGGRLVSNFGTLLLLDDILPLLVLGKVGILDPGASSLDSASSILGVLEGGLSVEKTWTQESFLGDNKKRRV